jgi:hypothetical protein
MIERNQNSASPLRGCLYLSERLAILQSVVIEQTMRQRISR